MDVHLGTTATTMTDVTQKQITVGTLAGWAPYGVCLVEGSDVRWALIRENDQRIEQSYLPLSTTAHSYQRLTPSKVFRVNNECPKQ